MFFTINEKLLTKYNYNADEIKAIIKYTAKKRIYSFKISSTELQLNDYCLKHYGNSLINSCLRLINSCSIMHDNNNNYIIIFKDTYLDNIASTITYGLPNMFGSRILRDAFAE